MSGFAILGATRGMGKQLARRMAERGDSLCLLGRDPARLEATRTDLSIRSPHAEENAGIFTASCDLLQPDTFEPALESAAKQLGRLDGLIVTAGLFADQAQLEASSELLEQLLTADFVNTVLLCELAKERLLKQGGGLLCVFSSVAGDRARTPVRLYGAAKAGLSHYLEGLDHAYRREGLVTLDVKPGFVRTEMTAHLAPPPFAGEPSAVAREVLAAIDRGSARIYTPRIWGLILWVIRLTPRTIMRRIRF